MLESRGRAVPTRVNPTAASGALITPFLECGSSSVQCCNHPDCVRYDDWLNMILEPLPGNLVAHVCCAAVSHGFTVGVGRRSGAPFAFIIATPCCALRVASMVSMESMGPISPVDPPSCTANPLVHRGAVLPAEWVEG